MQVPCENCGKITKKKPHIFKKNKHNFCSRACQYDWRLNHGGYPTKPRRGHNIKCDWCGKDIYRGPSKLNKTNFCSMGCYSKYKIDKRPKVTCKQCGKVFGKPKSTIKWDKIRRHKLDFCSNTCSEIYHTGNGNANWISDRDKLKCRPNKIKRHVAWRQGVFERDNYTCQLCGLRGTYLEPHHIKRWAEHKKLRYDIDNGITLCKPCHIKTRGKEKEFEEIFKKKRNI